MSASEKTLNYNLPLYGETDALNVLNDFNNAMKSIDKNIKNVELSASNADSKTNFNNASIENLKIAQETTNAKLKTTTETANNALEMARSASNVAQECVNDISNVSIKVDNLNNKLPTIRTEYITTTTNFTCTDAVINNIKYFKEQLSYSDYDKITITITTSIRTTNGSNKYMFESTEYLSNVLQNDEIVIPVAILNLSQNLYIATASTFYRNGAIIIKVSETIPTNTTLTLAFNIIKFFPK